MDRARGLVSRTGAATHGRGSRAGWFVALAVALVAVCRRAVSPAVGRSASPPAPRARFDVALPEQLGFDWPDWPNVSPDGQHLVFTARLQGTRRLWMRTLDGVVQPLAGTEGAAFPFWSPDSRTVAFFAGGKLKKVDVAGGPVTTLADAFSVGRGAWSGRNDPVRAALERADSRRRLKAAAPRAPSPALDEAQGETGHQFPRFLPDGRRFLFTAAGRQPGVYLALA